MYRQVIFTAKYRRDGGPAGSNLYASQTLFFHALNCVDMTAEELLAKYAAGERDLSDADLVAKLEEIASRMDFDKTILDGTKPGNTEPNTSNPDTSNVDLVKLALAKNANPEGVTPNMFNVDLVKLALAKNANPEGTANL
jgi:hypothetical protein